MAIIRKFQNNFTAGALSPGVRSRVDLQKYSDGCGRIENAVVLAHGGLTKRPGTKMVGEIPGEGLLIPFTYSVDQTCALCFFDSGDDSTSLRIYTQGETVTGSEGAVYQIETPYKAVDLKTLKFAQSADVLFLTHPKYPVYKLSRYGNDDWRFEQLIFNPSIQPPSDFTAVPDGFKDSTNTYVETQITYVVAAVDARENESMPSREVTVDTLSTWPQGATVDMSWKAVPGAVRYEVYKNARGYYTWIGSTKDLSFTDDNIEGDDSRGPKEHRDPFAVIPVPEGVYVAGEEPPPQENDVIGAEYYQLRFAYGNTAGAVGAASDTIISLQNPDDMMVVFPEIEGVDTCYTYFRSPEGAWSCCTASVESDADAVEITKVTLASGSSSGESSAYKEQYVITAVLEGAERQPSEAVIKSGTKRYPLKTTLEWGDIENASGYYVYRKDLRTSDTYPFYVRKYISCAEERVSKYTFSETDWEEAEVADPPENGARVRLDTAQAFDSEPKDAPDNYPGTVGIHQQRLVFGRTNAEPQTVWMTETGAFDSLAVATPLRADSAITATVDSKQMNEIRHFIALRELLMLTSGAEFKVVGGQNGAVTPTEIAFPPQSYWGVGHIPPLVIGTSILFVQNSNRHVRDLGYTLQEDGYSGNELTVLSEHLIDADIVDWAYQQSPYSTVWVCLANGRLLTFTYMKEQEIWAWSEHKSDGRFISVTSVREGAEDDVYFLVERFGKYFVEFQSRRHYGDPPDRAFFVDCGLEYEGSPITTVTGLNHLAGQQISVLADGSAVGLKEVSADGTVTLENPASHIVAGLPYAMEIETLDPDITAENGSMLGDKKTLVKAVFNLREARSFYAAIPGMPFFAVKAPMQQVWDGAPPLFTGAISANMPGHHREEITLIIRSEDPVPFTILGINQLISVG